MAVSGISLLGKSPKDFDVATDALPRKFSSCTFNRATSRSALRSGHGKVTSRSRRSEAITAISGWPPARRSPLRNVPKAGRPAPRFHDQCVVSGPETDEILISSAARADLKNGIIRAIGDPEQRFREDYLRMLRAVRFAARLGFLHRTRNCPRDPDVAQFVTQVAAERVRDEFVRILTEGGAKRGFELLDELGLLDVLLPEVARMKGVPQPPEFHPEGDVWTHTLIMLDGLRDPSADTGDGCSAP